MGLVCAVAAPGRALEESSEQAIEEPTPMRPDFGTYPLDALSRLLPEGQRNPRCPTEDMVTYRGSTIRFWLPAAMHRAFVPYVQRLEEIARDVAIKTYGRAPYRLSHMGAFVCRRIRRSSETMSEHALGNAIDLRGFDFLPARADQPLPVGTPPSLSRYFRTTVEEHWDAEEGAGAHHALFFSRLRERLEAEPELFGVMLGPSYPAHENHLHLDRAPIRFVRF